MHRMAAGTMLVLFTFMAACGRDASSREVTAPDDDAGVAARSSTMSSQDEASDGDHNWIAMLDDCDPTDASWAAVGGCVQRRGSVTLAEFNTEASSTLAPNSVIGHASWRNDPAYDVITEGRSLLVRNKGGRPHTFTKVAQFGGGRAPNPALSKGLVQAPECATAATSPNVAPGGTTEVSGLAVGSHRFQCCLHPWMRAVIEVKSK
jgi:hypothetical protein